MCLYYIFLHWNVQRWKTILAHHPQLMPGGILLARTSAPVAQSRVFKCSVLLARLGSGQAQAGANFKCSIAQEEGIFWEQASGSLWTAGGVTPGLWETLKMQILGSTFGRSGLWGASLGSYGNSEWDLEFWCLARLEPTEVKALQSLWFLFAY
jgi:hypothetical protein